MIANASPYRHLATRGGLFAAVLAIVLFPASGRSQDAPSSNYLAGNKLRVILADDGSLATTTEDLLTEWPIGTGREYVDAAYPVVVIGSRVASLDLEPGWASEGSTVAVSTNPETWPSSWPDRDASWDGRWNGRDGLGKLTADTETLLALRDGDLQVKVRVWQWAHYFAQDMLYLHYELVNTGSGSLDNVSVGFAVDPAVGGDNDDRMFFSDDFVVAVDLDGVGHGRSVAQAIGDWGPVGWMSSSLVETPGNPDDGIDNDGDGLVDESRFDGVDNDEDWNPETDDVGADGLPDTGDQGESDGVPTVGEPNFDATDTDESDQVGWTTFAAYDDGALPAPGSSELAAALNPGKNDDPSTAGAYVAGSGPVSIGPGQTKRFSVVMMLSAAEIDQKRNEQLVGLIHGSSYQFPVAPPRPHVEAVAENGQVTLYWDSSAEATPDFEGYKIFKSTDPGFNDVYNVTDDAGATIYSKSIATFDLDNGIEDLFAEQMFGFRYFLGKDTGLTHWWTDVNVSNGQTYYYAVVAFDRGDADQFVFPTESTKRIVVDKTGVITTDVNTVSVTPAVEAAGYQAPALDVAHPSGVSTGTVATTVIDRTLVRDAEYAVTFEESVSGELTYGVVDRSAASGPVTIFSGSTNYSTPEILNEGDPMFDGIRVFVTDVELAYDSTESGWVQGSSNWSISLKKNANLGDPEPDAVDLEVRFGEVGVDTAIFATPIPIPFEVWNVVTNRKENVLVLDENQDGAWSVGEPVYTVTGTTVQDFRPTKWLVDMQEPVDPATTPVAPVVGDVAELKTTKPLSVDDEFVINAGPGAVEGELTSTDLDRIAVVPNPYIVNNRFEQKAHFTGGAAEKRIQFIHLPTECTITIYDLRGRLLDTIEHHSAVDNGTAWWDLRTGDSDADEWIAYGMYVYHVDAPGIGQTIGRFGVIR